MANEVAKNEETEPVHPFQAEADKLNESRGEDKGTRVRVGMTRGKGSLAIKWEAFDESKPKTLPADIKEFMALTGIQDQAKLLEFLIVGYNDSTYTAASDPIAEFVNPSWDDDTKAQFRLVVRNYSKATGSSIEDTVSLMKPGIEKAFAAKQTK